MSTEVGELNPGTCTSSSSVRIRDDPLPAVTDDFSSLRQPKRFSGNFYRLVTSRHDFLDPAWARPILTSSHQARPSEPLRGANLEHGKGRRQQ